MGYWQFLVFMGGSWCFKVAIGVFCGSLWFVEVLCGSWIIFGCS